MAGITRVAGINRVSGKRRQAKEQGRAERGEEFAQQEYISNSMYKE